MLSRRTRARLALLVELALIPVYVREWRRASDEQESPFALGWFFTGAVFRVAYAWAFDQDVRGIRTDRRTRAVAALALGSVGAALGLLGDDGRAVQTASLGGHVAHIAYRCWYGLLRPLPGE